MMNRFWRDAKFSFRIPDDDVTFTPDSDRAFSFLQANLLSRSNAEPLRCLSNRETARPCFCPHHRQAKLQRRNTAPRLNEITLFAQFHVRRARRVIRDYEIDRAIAQGIPKLFLVLSLANWRTAFKFS